MRGVDARALIREAAELEADGDGQGREGRGDRSGSRTYLCDGSIAASVVFGRRSVGVVE
jgi:hypothetical protein